MHSVYKAGPQISNFFDVVCILSPEQSITLLPPGMNIWIQIKNETHVRNIWIKIKITAQICSECSY